MKSAPYTACMFNAGSLLSDHLKKARLTQAVIVDKTGISKQHISAMIAGKRRIPLDCLTHLAEALCLDGSDRKAFIEAVWRDHAPAGFSALLDELRAKFAQLSADHASIRDKLSSLSDDFRKPRRHKG